MGLGYNLWFYKEAQFSECAVLQTDKSFIALLEKKSNKPDSSSPQLGVRLKYIEQNTDFIWKLLFQAQHIRFIRVNKQCKDFSSMQTEIFLTRV